MTNDYLFKALLQRNNRVLTGLICSLLHLDSSQVRSVEILNPIVIGTYVEDKDFILDVKTVIQISFLDFTLFPEKPEFYATYQFRSEKNTIYSDKLRLHVVDLKKIGLATEEDKKYHIDQWAALFKSTTWEEIKMLAEKNEEIREASETIYRLSQEEKIKMQCQAREIERLRSSQRL